MKRFLVFVLSVVIVFLLCSCDEKQCWKCEKDISMKASFCEHCGASADGEAKQCWKCEKDISMNASFCEHCGASADGEAKQCWKCEKNISMNASFCEHCGVSTDGELKQEFVGIWQVEDSATYIYVYKNGTGDYYDGFSSGSEHYNAFTWDIEGNYFVKQNPGAFGGERTYKYELSGDCLLDAQGNVAYKKYSNDPTIDL